MRYSPLASVTALSEPFSPRNASATSRRTCQTWTVKPTSGFYLTFGRGACCVYHSLRWSIFLTDPAWQPVMLRACNTIADLLDAPDGVLTSDFHPAHTAFFGGAGYDTSLRAAPPGEGEVGSIAD